MLEKHPSLSKDADAKTMDRLRDTLNKLRGGSADVAGLVSDLQSMHKSGLCNAADLPDVIAHPHRLTAEATFEQWQALYSKASRHADLSLFEVRASTIQGVGLFVTRAIGAGNPLGIAWWQYQKPHIPGSQPDDFMTPNLACRYLPTEAFVGEPRRESSSIFDGVPPALRSACYYRAANHDCRSPALKLAFVHGLPPCAAPSAHGDGTRPEARCVSDEIIALPAAANNEFVASYYVASRAIAAGEEVTLDFRTLPQYMMHEAFENGAACPPPVEPRHLSLKELDARK
jgi:hypothetical protein